MAGYQQQDAHEFFCFVLEMMGATTPGAGGPAPQPRLVATATGQCTSASLRHGWAAPTGRSRRAAQCVAYVLCAAASGKASPQARVQCSHATWGACRCSAVMGHSGMALPVHRRPSHCSAPVAVNDLHLDSY